MSVDVGAAILPMSNPSVLTLFALRRVVRLVQPLLLLADSAAIEACPCRLGTLPVHLSVVRFFRVC